MKSKSKDKEALALWSEIALTRDKHRCQYPGCRRAGKHPHHIRSRTFRNTRYDTRNGIALCAYHHRFYAHGQYQEEFREFIIERMGRAEYDALVMRSQMVCKGQDLKLVIVFLKAVLRALPNGV